MGEIMHTKLYAIASALGGFMLFAFILGSHGLAGHAAAEEDSQLIERGRYLVTIAGCHDCHTPKVFGPDGMDFDSTLFLSGHPAGLETPEVPENVLGEKAWGGLINHHLTAWVGPWGVSYTQNITPDVETGIGTWTLDMFIRAIRTGKHMGEGRPILPPMPWFLYAKMPDEDLEAIYRYLLTIQPIRNPVPEPVPPKDR
jgi:hypothetical protein